MENLTLLQEAARRDGVDGRISSSLEEAAALLGEPADLEAALLEAISAADGTIERACRHILEAGGKRIRPMLVMLAHRAAAGRKEAPFDLAVACELLHNATLLHDDVIDEGEMRRGRSATRVVYGNAISVLAGDYLLVRTIELVSARGPRFLDSYMTTLKLLIDGELAQLQRRGKTDVTEYDYYRVVKGKTASLFGFAAWSGAAAGGADEENCAALRSFGTNVGTAFQLMDDVLDFTADPDVFGKNLYADIGEGKLTLPVILAAAKSDELKIRLKGLSDRESIFEDGARVIELIRNSGAIEETKVRARRHTDAAIDSLREISGLAGGPLRVLEELARALLSRGH